MLHLIVRHNEVALYRTSSRPSGSCSSIRRRRDTRLSLPWYRWRWRWSPSSCSVSRHCLALRSPTASMMVGRTGKVRSSSSSRSVTPGSRLSWLSGLCRVHPSRRSVATSRRWWMQWRWYRSTWRCSTCWPRADAAPPTISSRALHWHFYESFASCASSSSPNTLSDCRPVHE